MTVETEFVAALNTYAPLTALVGTGISKNAVDQASPLPIVAFTAAHEPQLGMGTAILAELVTFTAQCWGQTALQAAAVADQLQAALTFHNGVQTSAVATVLNRSSLYDGELKLDCEVLTIEWWAT